MKKSEKIKTKKFLINTVNMEINDIYKCSGKKYNGEKAIISLTSWKARVGTVSKTLFSLIKQCPGFHIVLVLSEEEFPKMEEELPDELMLFVKNNLIELLWVYKNYKAFKKVLFTMDKYRDAPVISADDDCIYTCNYAQELYDAWIKHKNCRISMENTERFGIKLLCGYAVLNPPNCFSNFDLTNLKKMDKKLSEDDMLYSLLSKKYNINFIVLHNEKKMKHTCYLHDVIEPLSKNRKYDNKSDFFIMKDYDFLR